MSSSRKVTFTKLAPAPVGPYSQAVKSCGPTLYLSGQIGLNPLNGTMVSDSVTEQAQQSFTNMKAVVESSGATLNDVIKVNIFVTNMDNFAQVNEVMKTFFETPYPARSTVGVASLPRGALVEVEAIVQLPNESSKL
ncbi:hypothetical protein RDWZM_009433 [Blomia tropicalis]|uniref:Uncharacterized protein n=1 Tax=Blomia tropicalis TaxID=40697 RepID=A0A9Q0RMA5_BLOTA|nr:hypothetical protein BLOT_004919 [Blomia tropicalis]KAJ6218276.1 hypothetical protein RDWZM_009433 [Blomia tropicalis]WBV73512.1 allergen [Blomia tropicalis]